MTESTLRQHPDTGRLAERVPHEFAEPDRPWFTYTWTVGGPAAALLSDEDVAGWAPVTVVPA